MYPSGWGSLIRVFSWLNPAQFLSVVKLSDRESSESGGCKGNLFGQNKDIILTSMHEKNWEYVNTAFSDDEVKSTGSI